MCDTFNADAEVEALLQIGRLSGTDVLTVGQPLDVVPVAGSSCNCPLSVRNFITTIR